MTVSWDLRTATSSQFFPLYQNFNLKPTDNKLSWKFLCPLVRGLDEDKMPCPYCALKIYRARTNSIRKQNAQMRRLFISYTKSFSKDVCKNTLASWINYLIKLAYDKCPHHLIQLSAAKPHEVRAMSASLVWRASIGLQDILLAACWLNTQPLLPSIWKTFPSSKMNSIHWDLWLWLRKLFPPLFLFIGTVYILHFEWELPAGIDTVYL